MGNTYGPVGAALPGRRDAVRVEAGGLLSAGPGGGVEPIVAPRAQDRLLELIEREQLPGDVRATLAGALMGDLRRQQLLFQAMIDTWPRLQKNLGEVKRAARRAAWQVRAYAPRGGSAKPDAAAEGLAREVEEAIWSMRPDAARGTRGFEGTVEELAAGYFLGHQVLEVHWQRCGAAWRPGSTRVVPPRFYSYPYSGAEEDRLMLDRSGGMGYLDAYEDFPEHRFLIAINGSHPGHPAVAAPLRALAGYWLAAVYGMKWLLQFAQLCGVPFRWAEYANEQDKPKICRMLESIGSAGWGAFPAGTKLNFVEAKRSADQLPQKVLTELADEQCDVFILGQTLTSSEGAAGSRALGEVHASVRQDVMEGVCDFIGEVLSYQLVPALVALNHGAERADVPGIWAAHERPKDEKALAERDRILVKELGMPVGRAWLYERHGVPVPADGEEIFQPEGGVEKRGAAGDGRPSEKARVAAGEAGALTALSAETLAAAVAGRLTSEGGDGPEAGAVLVRLAALVLAGRAEEGDFAEAVERVRGEGGALSKEVDAAFLREAFAAEMAGAVRAEYAGEEEV